MYYRLVPHHGCNQKKKSGTAAKRINVLTSALIVGTRNKYAYLAIIIMAGYALSVFPCIFHTITGYPCPACGTRRALLILLNGNIYDSILVNPYGLLLVLLTAIYLTGMTIDFIRKKDQFQSWLTRAERHLMNKYILASIILLTILNWIWNIHKGL